MLRDSDCDPVLHTSELYIRCVFVTGVCATDVRLFLRRKTASVRVLQGKAAGAVSGGTIASLMGAIFEETPEELKLSADPYALNPPEAHRWGPQ